ncbi:MAG TPA: DUF6152 family protein [Micropepsaceae bacterium]|nr:DUF6152 family protein [Micropepsaceae bacterium]
MHHRVHVIAPALALAAGLAASAPASAHHSYAMFSVDKRIAVEGTVKQFMWTNPHSWIRLEVMDQNGKQQDWNVEMGSLTILVNLGWTPKTLQPGDKIKLTVHPMKSGLPGGDFVSLDAGGHGAVKNDGGAQERLKQRAARNPNS